MVYGLKVVGGLVCEGGGELIKSRRIIQGELYQKWDYITYFYKTIFIQKHKQANVFSLAIYMLTIID